MLFCLWMLGLVVDVFNILFNSNCDSVFNMASNI